MSVSRWSINNMYLWSCSQVLGSLRGVCMPASWSTLDELCRITSLRMGRRPCSTSSASHPGDVWTGRTCSKTPVYVNSSFNSERPFLNIYHMDKYLLPYKVFFGYCFIRVSENATIMDVKKMSPLNFVTQFVGVLFIANIMKHTAPTPYHWF